MPDSPAPDSPVPTADSTVPSPGPDSPVTPRGFVAVANARVCLLLDARGAGLPSVVHWGAPLDQTDLDRAADLADALSAPVPPAGPDSPVPPGLLPEHATGYPGRPGLRGHRNGADWTPLFALESVTPSPAPSGTTSGGTAHAAGSPADSHQHGIRRATLTAVDEHAALRLRTEIELAPDGLLRIRHVLRNTGRAPYALDGLEAALPLPAHATELLDFTGRHCRERVPQRQPFHDGLRVRESRRGRPGLDATMGMLAGASGFGFRHGEVWAAHVAWSGGHTLYAERLPEGGGMLGGGELLAPGELTLGPGEEYAMPRLCAAYSDTGIDGISSAFHGWLRSRPPRARWSRPRPVVLNTWEAVYFRHDEQRLRALAETAAEAGVERFVLDDGWFQGRRDDHAGLGDWYVDEEVWPRGLGPLIGHVRSLGMEFGLWVEPEMVNPDSRLFRDHPEWVLAPPGRTPPKARHQLVLDLARPDAWAYVHERLDALLNAHQIAALKWDHNRDLVAAQHAGRAGAHTQTVAVYRLLDALRDQHPDVEIESCASGGGRVDLGILERTDRVWTSDCNDALERQAIQRWTGVFLPPELLGAHIGPARAHTTGRTHALDLRAATALFGHAGAEWDIDGAADDAERAALQRVFALYKRHRALLHSGAVVRADHPDPGAWVHGVVAADRGEALFCYAQLAVPAHGVPAPVRLPGLDPAQRYRIRVVHPTGTPPPAGATPPRWWSAGGTALSGRALEGLGLQPPLTPPERAWLLHLEATAGTTAPASPR